MPPKKVTPAKGPSKPAAKPGAKGTTAKKTETASKSQPKGAAAAPAPPPAPPEITAISLKQLPTIISDSTNGKIKASKKWPLIIDPETKVSTFIRYQNANYIQAELPGEMAPDKIRQALIGALRFGKPFVIDVETHDISDIQAIEEVQKGLLESLLDHSILEEEKYLELVRPGDENEYSNSAYYHTEEFCFMVLTSQPEPNPVLAARFTCFKVE